MPILIISFIRKINHYYNEGTNVMIPSVLLMRKELACADISTDFQTQNFRARCAVLIPCLVI